MPTILCHPANWEEVKSKIEQGQFNKQRGSMFADFRVRTDPSIDQFKPTGRYKLQDGKTVDKSSINIKTKFIEYGPEDVDWLVYAGLITEEQEMVFFVIEDTMFRVRHDFMPVVSRPITHITD